MGAELTKTRRRQTFNPEFQTTHECQLPPETFERYRRALISQPLSSIWRGHGSAIFLEFGPLVQTTKRDGSPGNPRGSHTVMIEWSWRIEDETSILCGSCDDETVWQATFNRLIGQKVEELTLFGRLPEISIGLAGRFCVSSFMTANDQPQWTVFMNAADGEAISWLSVVDGQVVETFE